MKRVLVTGGSRGIGAATVRAFAAAGYDVTFIYLRSAAASEALAAETGATPLCLDVGDGEAVASVLAGEIAVHGRFDILVNNAGVSSFSLLTDLSDADWRRTMAVDLDGAFYCAKAVLPGMISRKWGRIINVSSMWGLAGSSMEVHYSTAKAGLIGFTKALAKEEGPSGITVNCVAPGVIDTEMNAALTPETLAELIAETPAGRLGTPEEVAKLILFLASEDASFITGQVICQSGGLVI